MQSRESRSNERPLSGVEIALTTVANWPIAAIATGNLAFSRTNLPTQSNTERQIEFELLHIEPHGQPCPLWYLRRDPPSPHRQSSFRYGGWKHVLLRQGFGGHTLRIPPRLDSRGFLRRQVENSREILAPVARISL